MPSSGSPPILYLDACCFLAYLAEEEGRVDVIASLLEQSLEKELRIMTSVLSLTEAAFLRSEKESGVLDPNVEKRIDDMFNDYATIGLVEYSQLIANDARSLLRQSVASNAKTLKPPDAIHIASALRVRAGKLYTYDSSLLHQSGSYGIEIVEPFTSKVRMF